MKVFKLEVKDRLLSPEGADAVGFGEWTNPRGFVVLAESEEDARSIAAGAKDENGYEYGGPWWTDPESTICEEVDLLGPPRVIMMNEPTG
jgi:hypothetical protein